MENLSIIDVLLEEIRAIIIITIITLIIIFPPLIKKKVKKRKSVEKYTGVSVFLLLISKDA